MAPKLHTTQTTRIDAIYYVQPGGQLNCPPGVTLAANYTEGAPVQH